MTTQILTTLNSWMFADTNGTLIDNLGIREDSGVAYRATYIVDPHGEVQHVSVNPLSVGRNPKEILRILDALQSDELCPCNRPVGGDVINFVRSCITHVIGYIEKHGS